MVQKKMTLENAYGSVQPSKKPEDFKAISRAAKDEKAEKTHRRLAQGQ